MRKLIFILIALISFSQAQTIQYIGAPTTTVISRGNFRTDSIFYLPKRTKTPTDTAAFRYQISDSSLYYWTGYQWTKVQSASSFASVDTLVISTRSWRQKGIDSVQYNVGLKVNISDTSNMLSPYIVGSGTSNYFPKFNSTRSVINSKLYESNLNLLFNSTTPYLTTSGISTIENNGTSAALYVLKTLDTARAYVSFGGANTMDINNLRAGDIRFYTNATLRGRFQTDGTFRLNSLTGTGSRIVVADDNGVLSASSSATGLVDTAVLSTRAWRQKGDDSLGAIIATKGSGTVTSIATGYGLSGGTITTTGTISADTALMATRLRMGKVVDSLSLVKQNVLTNPVTGTGITNRMIRFTGTSTIDNASIADSASSVAMTILGTNNIGIGTVNPQFRLHTFGITGIRAETSSGNSSTGIDFASSFVGGRVGGYYMYPGASLIGNNVFGESASGNIQNIVFSESVFPLKLGTISTGVTQLYTNSLPRLTVFGNGRVSINSTTDAGAYTLQNNGALYNTGSAILAATSGNVGIGTTNPVGKLVVVGASNNTYISIDNVGSGENYYASNTFQQWQTAGSAKMTLNSSGELLVGTTTDAGNYMVQVSGNAYVTGDAILAVGASSNNVRIGSANASSAKLFVSKSGLNTIFDSGIASDARLEFHYNGNRNSLLNFDSGITGFQQESGITFYFSGGNGVSVGSSSINSTAILDVQSTTKGFLPPRMTTTQRDAISSPAAGLVIYNTTTSKLQVYTTSWTDLH